MNLKSSPAKKVVNLPRPEVVNYIGSSIYGVDFEKKPLINSEAKTIKYTLKKNKKKW